MMAVATGTTPYRDEPVPQFVPSTWDSKYNCVPAGAACNVGRATVGRIRLNGQQIRTASPAAGEARGMSYLEVEIGVEKLTDLDVQVRYAATTTDLKNLADAGYSGLVSIDCSVTVHTKRATNGFTGDHTVGWYDYRYSTGGHCLCEKAGTTAGKADHGEILVEDPGTTTVGYQWWSVTLLYKAALARTTDSNGLSHGINLVIFPDVENVKRIGVGDKFRDSPFRSSKAVKSVAKGQSYTVTGTINGGGWPRADGSTAYGWYRVPGDLYVPGKGLR